MLFGSGLGNPTKDGELREKIFLMVDEYSITAKENIGWKIIESIQDNHKVVNSATKNKEQYYSLKFLNKQLRNPTFTSSKKTPGAKILQKAIDKLA